MNVQKEVPAKAVTTFGVGGVINTLIDITSTDELIQAFDYAQKAGLPAYVLGGGSNSLFLDGALSLCLVRPLINGIKITSEDENSVKVLVGAGVNWDDFVAWSVEHNYSGIEALSKIPGSVGGTPVQNVGAYGQEVKDTIEFVRVYDRLDQTVKELSNHECEFSYRNSIFKQAGKDKYVIIEVQYVLSKKPIYKANYPSLVAYLQEKNITNPTIADIRSAVSFIRSTKLPDPSVIRNAGSFFKNAYVTKEEAKVLLEKFPDMQQFPEGNRVKVPSGWLIEHIDLKGKSFGHIGVYEKNALVLTNDGEATFADLEDAKTKIIEMVQKKFGIILSPEPVILGA